MSGLAAIVYCLAALPPTAVQIALAAGAPLAHLTLGGRWAGRLPAKVRPFAAFQALILIALMSIVLDHQGFIDLGWPNLAIWFAVVVTLLTTIANLITPSRPERLLWGPMTAIMSCAILWIAFV